MYKKIWNDCLDTLKASINHDAYCTFIQPIEPIAISTDENTLTLSVPSAYFAERIEQEYKQKILAALHNATGLQNMRLVLRIPALANTSGGVRVPQANTPKLTDHVKQILTNPFEAKPKQKFPTNLNSDYSFDNFVVGDSNRVAFSAGKDIAEKFGKATLPFNPLFIYGASGMGKTHLAQAIGNAIAEQDNKSVLYVAASEFASQYQDAIKNEEINNFMHFYQQMDVLIVDDIQMFTAKEKTQLRFFEVFNYLQQRGCQIILTADQPLTKLQGLIDQRLLTRFRGGFAAELQSPDYRHRFAILKRKAQRDRIDISDDILTYIANSVDGSIRELEGILISVIAQAIYTQRKYSVALVKETIEKNLCKEQLHFTVEGIAKQVAEFCHLSLEDLLGTKRHRDVVQARHLAMSYAKELTGASLAAIGAYFGGRNHTTVLYACKIVKDLLQSDKQFKMRFNELDRYLKNKQKQLK